MEKIIVNVSWCDKNYSAALSENVPGASKSLVQNNVVESLKVCIK